MDNSVLIVLIVCISIVLCVLIVAALAYKRDKLISLKSKTKVGNIIDSEICFDIDDSKKRKQD